MYHNKYFFQAKQTIESISFCENKSLQFKRGCRQCKFAEHCRFFGKIFPSRQRTAFTSSKMSVFSTEDKKRPGKQSHRRHFMGWGNLSAKELSAVFLFVPN